MKILVDADACPVVKIVENIAKSRGYELVLICDTAHLINSDYAKVVIVDKGADSADIRLANLCSKGDVVVTQDYGVAAMALSKRAYAIHQSGMVYTNDNIDSLLSVRHVAKKLRKSNKNHLKGPKPRTADDDIRFEESFIRLIESVDSANE